MPKKRRKRKPGKKPPGRPDRPLGPRAADEIRGTPTEHAARSALEAGFPGPGDASLAEKHMNRAMVYELWLQSGMDIEELPIDRLPPLYVRFFDTWPDDAFEFYRHQYFSYLVRILGTVPWMPFILSVIKRLGDVDAAGLEHLRSTLDGTKERFFRQHENAHNYVVSVVGAGSRYTRLMWALQAWVNFYEIDMPLWLIGVLGKGLRTNKIDPTYGGGPETATNQGSLIDQVQSQIQGTPLEGPFSSSYDSGLRNTLGHNDWGLKGNEQEGFLLIDKKSQQSWSEDECWDRIETTQLLQQSLLLTAQLILSDTLIPPDEFSDIGVISMTSVWPEAKSELPTVVVAQLWCFHELDPRGSWLDGAELTLHEGDDESVVRLSENAVTFGEPRDPETRRHIEGHSWAHIIRFPIAPPFDMGLPKLTTTDEEEFEIVGAPDEHVVPVTLTYDQDPDGSESPGKRS